MNPILRNSLAIVAGLIVGSIVNMSLIMVSGKIIPPPEGADVTTLEGLKASIHLFGPKNFIFPFLAHALGTFVGALLATFIAGKNNMRPAIIIGAVFFAGGFANVMMLPAPMWFNITDLVGAYFPMSFLGARLLISSKVN